MSYSGTSKNAFCARLSEDWLQLCDELEIPQHEKQKFQHGEQARAIWEWLERRGRLSKLPSALRGINREDLAALLEREAATAAAYAATPASVANYAGAVAAGGQPPLAPRSGMRIRLLAVGIGLAVLAALAATATVLHRAGGSSTTFNGLPPGDGIPAADLVHDVPRESLRVSSIPCSGNLDKFDLDTRQRGRGNQVQIPGCVTEGRRAELILDPERLHTPDDADLLLLLDRTDKPNYPFCYQALRNRTTKMVGSVPLSALRADAALCVKTDEGLIALVRILEKPRSGTAELVFSATVWRPQESHG